MITFHHLIRIFTIFLVIYGCNVVGTTEMSPNFFGATENEYVNPYPHDGPAVMIWEITTDGESITLPLRSGYSYNFTIDWGDGTSSEITSDTDPDKTHTYTIAGRYLTTMTGLAESWYFNNAGSINQLVEVKSLGGLGWTRLDSAFAGCTNLTYFAGGETSSVTNMNYMFQGTTSLITLDISSFNTESVTQMSGMFYGASALTSLNLSNFNTMNVQYMTSLFQNTTSLSTLNLSSFDTSSVIDMASMFESSGVRSLDLAHFNTTSLMTIYNMFKNASSLTTLNLSNFGSSAITNLQYLFYGCSSLTSLNLSGFDSSGVTVMRYMFFGTTLLSNIDLSSFSTENVADMQWMFAYSGISSLDISSFSATNLTNVSSMFQDASNLVTLNSTDFDISAVGNTANIFTNKNAALTVYCNFGTFATETCN